MNESKEIEKHFEDIAKILGVVYEYINTGRYHDELIINYNTWNQICSSLYVISDTILGIKSYLNKAYPKDMGLKYL